MGGKIDKVKKIKILLTDVDCVLTDGGMYYSKEGDQMKKFHTRDGMGVTLLKRLDIHTIIITKEKTQMVKKWAKKMKVEKLYDGIIKKEDLLEKICKLYHTSPEEVGYIGDDVNDMELLKKVGFSSTPNDGISHVKKIVDYICTKKGGEGAFREVVDLIISVKHPNTVKFY